MTLNKNNNVHGKDNAKKNLTRRVIIFKRWFDIIILSFVALLIYFVISLFLNLKPAFFKDVSIIGISPIWIQCTIYILVFALLWSPAVRYGSFSTRSFLPSTFFKYPPFWLACIFSILAISFLQPYVSIISSESKTLVPPIIMFCAFGVVIAGAVIAVVYSKLIYWHSSSCDNLQENHKVESHQPITEDASALLQWIEEGKPIETTDKDRLNNKPFAERIISVLQQHEITIAVVGGYGAGKSSILNMVKSYLRTDKTTKQMLIPCDVCGWGLSKGSAAETILKQLIQACAQHVDCLGISNLPTQYGESIGHVSAWSKALSGLMPLSYDPMVALERMDRVLLAIDRRVVIFFEDLDRNWQGNDFWIEIIALLDRLKKLDRVSFVLAITGTNKIGDIINRISDHIEIVPKLSYDHVSRIYLNFKRLCFQNYKDKDILFNPKESRYRRIISLDIVMQDQIDNGIVSAEDAVLQDQISYLSKILRPDELDAITVITENPRNLKHALRRTYRAWQSLHGEIEFDHLFIANIFRIAVPEVFNFIHEHLSDIHWLDQQSVAGDKKQPVREKLQKELSEIINNAPRYDSVEKLVRFLFPYWRPVSGSYGVIQGFSDTKPTDYWNRMIREKLDDGEISDQAVAKALTEWKQNKDLSVYEGHSLAHAVTSIPKLPEKIVQFGELLDGHDVHVLLSQLFEDVSHVKGIRPMPVPGIKELKRLLQEKEFSGHGQWLIDEVSKLFPVDLSIANSVFRDFWPIADATEGQRVCNALLEKAKLIYSDKEIFIKAIETHSSSVMEFIVSLNSAYKHYSGIGYNPDKWSWLAELLLDTVKTHGSIVISQILEFAVFKQVELPDRPWLLNYEFIKTLFQERQREVMFLLSNIDASQFPEKIRTRATTAREMSMKWLLENPEKVDVSPSDASIIGENN
jgi:hypothetical protein